MEHLGLGPHLSMFGVSDSLTYTFGSTCTLSAMTHSPLVVSGCLYPPNSQGVLGSAYAESNSPTWWIQNHGLLAFMLSCMAKPSQEIVILSEVWFGGLKQNLVYSRTQRPHSN